MRTLSLRTAPLHLGLAALISTTCLASPAFADSLRGVVETGGGSSAKPLANVNVTLYEATTAQPKALGQATTNTSGQFVISSPKDTTSSIFYASADIRKGVELVTILGPDLPFSTTINELTSVAASYSMAQFYKTEVISGNSFGLRIAAGMNNNIVSPATGKSSPVLLTSPNADETNSLRSTRSLANLLAACVHDPSVTASFLDLTKPPHGTLPHDTAQAMAYLARNPGENVEQIFQLTKLRDSYSPALVRMPDAWTVTVKVNDSGDDNKLIAGMGYLVFDANGYAWITNNVNQGTRTSSRFMVVLKPNGKPADGRGWNAGVAGHWRRPAGRRLWNHHRSRRLALGRQLRLGRRRPSSRREWQRLSIYGLGSSDIGTPRLSGRPGQGAGHGLGRPRQHLDHQLRHR